MYDLSCNGDVGQAAEQQEAENLTWTISSFMLLCTNRIELFSGLVAARGSCTRVIGVTRSLRPLGRSAPPTTNRHGNRQRGLYSVQLPIFAPDLRATSSNACAQAFWMWLWLCSRGSSVAGPFQARLCFIPRDDTRPVAELTLAFNAPLLFTTTDRPCSPLV